VATSFHRSDPDEGQGRVHSYRPARRCDERERAHCHSYVRSKVASSAWTRISSRSLTFISMSRQERLRRTALGRRGDDHGHREPFHRQAGPQRRGHDRGGDPPRQGSADRRREDEGACAHRAGLTTVILPRRNERDLEDVPEDVRSKMSFVLVERIDEALKAGLLDKVKQEPARVLIA